MLEQAAEQFTQSIDKEILCKVLFHSRVSATNLPFETAIGWLSQELGLIGYRWDYSNGHFYFRDPLDASFFALKWSNIS